MNKTVICKNGSIELRGDFIIIEKSDKRIELTPLEIKKIEYFPASPSKDGRLDLYTKHDGGIRMKFGEEHDDDMQDVFEWIQEPVDRRSAARKNKMYMGAVLSFLIIAVVATLSILLLRPTPQTLIGSWRYMGATFYVFAPNGSGSMAGMPILWTADNGVLSICNTPAHCLGNCLAPQEWNYRIERNRLILSSRLAPGLTYTYRRQRSANANTSPTVNTASDAADNSVSIDVALAALHLTLSDYRDNFWVDYRSDVGVVHVFAWVDGAAVEVMLAYLDVEGYSEAWEHASNHLVDMSLSMGDTLRRHGHDVFFAFSLLNDIDRDSVMLSIMDGVVIFDILEEMRNNS